MDGKRAMADLVHFVCAFRVCAFPVLYAMGSAVCYARCGKLRRCVAEDDTAVWFWARMCFAALQATIAALALVLPYRSWRITRALVYLEVAVVLVGRCTYASIMPQGLPRDRDVKILLASGIFGLAVADIHSFLARVGQE